MRKSRLTRLPQRFTDKIVVSESGCWLWQGWTEKRAPRKLSYGKVWWQGRMRYAHRVVYELLVGAIPEGAQLDHVKARGCVGPQCVNPAHLEPVSARENVRRGRTGDNSRLKTHCPRNHPYDKENTYINSRGGRMCRLCPKERRAERRANAQAAQRV